MSITLPHEETFSGIIFQRTGELRWHADLVQKPLRLQEAWRCWQTGKIDWRDIPTVIGEEP